MHIDKKNLKILILLIFSMPFVYILTSMYLYGDQIHYRFFYDEVVKHTSIESAYALYYGTLGTLEPIYFIIAYYISSFLDKDIYITFVNILILYFLLKILVDQKASLIVLLLVLTNYYLMVLFSSAERLKFSFLFLLISFSMSGYKRWIFQIIAFFTHVQISLIIIALQAPRVIGFLDSLRRMKIKRDSYFLLFLVLVSMACMVFMGGHIKSKLQYYDGGLTSLLKPVVFMMLSFFCARDKIFLILIANAPLILASFIVGEERIAILSYILFMYFGVNHKRGLNIPTIISCVYFSVRGLIFFIDVINNGEGFN